MSQWSNRPGPGDVLSPEMMLAGMQKLIDLRDGPVVLPPPRCNHATVEDVMSCLACLQRLELDV